MKKLPIIGLVIGAVAALFAFKKKKSGTTPEETPPPTGDAPSA
jgi:LPXTG-motif cell wall-anchored protein